MTAPSSQFQAASPPTPTPAWPQCSLPPPGSLPGLDCWSIYNWFSASLNHHCIEPSQLPSLFVHLSSSAVGPAPHHHVFLSRNLGSSSSIFLSACGWSWRPLPEHPGARCCRDAHTERMRCALPGHREDNDLSASLPGHDENQ